MPLDLKNLQTYVAKWGLHNFGDQPSYLSLLGAMEELGELAHAHLKMEQGIRGGLNPMEMRAKKMDAIGDIIIYLTDYCHREHIDMEYAVASTWWEVSKRDWKKYPKDGISE